MEQANFESGAKGAAGGAGCLAVLLVLLLGSFAIGGGLETESPSMTPTPTLDNSAAIVREVGIIVQPVVEAAAGAVRADTVTAHATATPVPPSEMVQIGRAWGWPGAFALVSCGGVLALAAVAIAWIWSKRPIVVQESPQDEEPKEDEPAPVIVHNNAPDEALKES